MYGSVSNVHDDGNKDFKWSPSNSYWEVHPCGPVHSWFPAEETLFGGYMIMNSVAAMLLWCIWPFRYIITRWAAIFRGTSQRFLCVVQLYFKRLSRYFWNLALDANQNLESVWTGACYNRSNRIYNKILALPIHEITRAITPWIVLHSVQLPLLISWILLYGLEGKFAQMKIVSFYLQCNQPGTK